MSTDIVDGVDRSHLSRIDPRAGRRVARVPVLGVGGATRPPRIHLRGTGYGVED